MEKFQNKFRIPSNRLQNWNYGWAGAYFVTICTKDREYYFGDVIDGKMTLSGVGIIADILWHEIKNHTKNVELGEFVVMPNHVHGILILNGPAETNDPVVVVVETTHALSLPHPPPNPHPLSVPHPPPNPHPLSVPHPPPNPHPLSVPHPPSVPDPLSVPHPRSNPDPPSIPFPPPTEKTIGQKRFQHQGKNTLSSIVGAYKSAVTKHAHRLGMEFGWQPRFHDRIIQDDSEYRRKSQYILNNPAKWPVNRSGRSAQSPRQS